MQTIEFSVVGGRQSYDRRPNSAVLIEDNWDDWFTYSTLYILKFFDNEGIERHIGEVKIGQAGMAVGKARPDLPKHFSQLDPEFFSLGQDGEYYEALNHLGEDVRRRILDSINDLAANPSIWEKYREEHVVKTSLLRSVSTRSVEGQFNRMTQGGAKQTEYRFAYRAPIDSRSGGGGASFVYRVDPDRSPPTNIHVLIGRNGVGKTKTIQDMIDSLMEGVVGTEGNPGFEDFTGDYRPHGLFSNLVSVSFSAFDRMEISSSKGVTANGLVYEFIGLRDPDTKLPKSPEMLAEEFVMSCLECREPARALRLRRALKILSSDRIFRDADIEGLLLKQESYESSDADLDEAGKDGLDLWKLEATRIFGLLSSGHEVVLLTLVRLIESVEERTLVLLDEPEGHLHPPLLSAFVRALSDLMVDRNGVAIIATHSPVVLQEVPSDCATIIFRSGGVVKVSRPSIETFGENVGILTREVFGLEVNDSGFCNLLREVADRKGSYDEAFEEFGGRLGAEAQAILRGIFAERQGGTSDAL